MAIPALASAVLAACASPGAVAQNAAQKTDSAQQLIREVVYNELRDHQSHGFWRYWVKQHTPDGIRVEEQVETAGGPITRVLLADGRRLSDETRHVEDARLEDLMNSPAEQENHKQAYAEDEARMTRVVSMLPDAFLFEDLGQSNGVRHLRFHPNPKYTARGIETRLFHALNGDLYIDARMKRMKRLEGRLDEDLGFGLGLLGKVNKGSWFQMERVPVNTTEWKTTHLEVHISGRAVLFKSLAKDTSEERGGFAQVPAGLSMVDGVRMLNKVTGFDSNYAKTSFGGGN